MACLRAVSMEEKEKMSEASEKETKQEQEKKRFFNPTGIGSMLSEKERKSLLAYLALGVIIVEFSVTVVAILHGVTNMTTLPDGSVEYNFPWKAYLVSVFLAPVGVMFIIQIIGMGFSRVVMGDPEMADVDGEHVPERVRKWVHLVQGMPTAILLAGLLFVGLVLYNMDILMQMLVKLGETAAELALYGGVALFAAWLISYTTRLWLMYKTRKMQEEYAFRREVLERTGIAIIDQKTAVTADGRMITSGKEQETATIEALPVAAGSSNATSSIPKSLPVGQIVEEK